MQTLLAGGNEGSNTGSNTGSAVGVDALVVTDVADIRWLTGFAGSNGWAVVRPNVTVVGTDLRYRDRAIADVASSGVEVVASSSRSELDAALVDAAGRGPIGVDPTTVTHARWTELAASLDAVSIESPIRTAREIKDDAEVARIEAAARAADDALAEVEHMVHGAGESVVTEADIRDELEYRMRRHGADDRSYHTIVATGPEHAARPHHEVSRRSLRVGDTVVIDVGALVDGYHSDMTRSYVVGEPTAQQRELYQLVHVSQQAGIDTLRGGISAQRVDRACRDVFVEAGYGDWFVHGTGHGVGLDIHESPMLTSSSTDVISAGNVVTIEPGLYRGGFGGFRIEDLLVVTSDGSRRLNQHPARPFADSTSNDYSTD